MEGGKVGLHAGEAERPAWGPGPGPLRGGPEEAGLPYNKCPFHLRWPQLLSEMMSPTGAVGAGAAAPPQEFAAPMDRHESHFTWPCRGLGRELAEPLACGSVGRGRAQDPRPGGRDPEPRLPVELGLPWEGAWLSGTRAPTGSGIIPRETLGWPWQGGGWLPDSETPPQVAQQWGWGSWPPQDTAPTSLSRTARRQGRGVWSQ